MANIMFEKWHIDNYNVGLLLLGILILLVSLLPKILKERIITEPIVYLAIGVLYYLITGNEKVSHVLMDEEWLRHFSEIGVLVALTSTGLKLNDPFLKSTWKHSIRLLLIAMPISIILAYFVGAWFLAMAPATAALLGAVMAPTDPVLASEIQTSPPGKKDESPTRVALTTEAGLNDGLAFPFTFLAIKMANAADNSGSWLLNWVMMDVVYRIVVGVVVGYAIGWVLFKLIFSLPQHSGYSRIGTGMLTLALTFIPYSITELMWGYGFIATFVAACVFRHYEVSSRPMESLHEFAEDIENTVVALLFTILGVYVAYNFKFFLDAAIILAALLLILVIRPLAGYISLIGMKLSPLQRFTMSFFGIRGLGSLFYLMYAFHHATFSQKDSLIAVVLLTIIFSTFIHGISATFIMEKIDREKV